MPAPSPGPGFWAGVRWAIGPSLLLWAGIIYLLWQVLP